MLKKWLLPGMILLLLTGCGAEGTFETVADESFLPVMAQAGEILVELPPEAAAPAGESEDGVLYQCDGYEILLQTLEGGDMDATIRHISGYDRQALTVMYTDLDPLDRYALVWACAGENGDRVGKAVILDDGSYHYVLTVLVDAQRTAEYEEVFAALFASFHLA